MSIEYSISEFVINPIDSTRAETGRPFVVFVYLPLNNLGIRQEFLISLDDLSIKLSLRQSLHLKLSINPQTGQVVIRQENLDNFIGKLTIDEKFPFHCL